jgi:hypothetical protein
MINPEAQGLNEIRIVEMKSTLLSLSVVFALAGAGAAFAQDQSGSQMQGGQGGHHGEFRAACGADMQTYCASAQSRDDRRACVQANSAKFSQGCQTFLQSHMHGGGNGQ